jgi:hypothetical protein
VGVVHDVILATHPAVHAWRDVCRVTTASDGR